jgi:16S rRNA processing protein RimM
MTVKTGDLFMNPLITIGQVLAPWGIKGDVKVLPLTDFPQRFKTLKTVYIASPTSQAVWIAEIEAVRYHQRFVLLKLNQIDSRDEAEKLRNCLLQVDEPFPLPAGHYYHFQIIGLRVFTELGEDLGEVKEVLTPGGNDVYVVENEKGEEVLIPALKQVVQEIDLEQGIMRVKLLEGLR